MHGDDFMRVELLRFTPDPERLCAAAAMTSYKNKEASGLFEKLDLDKARKTLRRVIGHGHLSVIEHASFTFSVEGVSRALTHQLVRHRLASYTQQSQRYVGYSTLRDYVVPERIEENEKAKKVYENALTQVMEAYQRLLDYGILMEDARYVLSNAAKTNIVITMNARELRHFFNLRCCMRAQLEMREMATEMLRQAKRAAPVLFENAGPSCVEFGYCPEKELKPSTCRINEIKKKFIKL